jgi:hypothetical protein
MEAGGAEDIHLDTVKFSFKTHDPVLQIRFLLSAQYRMVLRPR